MQNCNQNIKKLVVISQVFAYSEVTLRNQTLKECESREAVPVHPIMSECVDSNLKLERCQSTFPQGGPHGCKRVKTPSSKESVVSPPNPRSV